MRNFHDDLAWSKRFTELWDSFWNERYKGSTINRDIPIELDKKGIDVIITYDGGVQLLIDEKVTCDIFPDYPIEVMKNTELLKKGWALANRGITIAIAKHPKDEVRFSDTPVVFDLNDKFRERIMQSSRYDQRILGTRVGAEDGYHTVIKRVPKEDLLIFNDDAKWISKYGDNHKLWEY